MWSRVLFIFFLFFSVTVSVFTEENEGTVTRLEWTPVEGSDGYIIEIKNDKEEILVSKKIDVPYYVVDTLPPGNYKQRVGVINKFGKVEGNTDWFPFTLLKASPPVLDREDIYTALLDEQSKTITLTGKNFQEGMTGYLIFEGKKIPIEVQVQSDTSASVKILVKEKLQRGIYDLTLENPRNKSLSMSRSFIVTTTPERAQRLKENELKIRRKEVPPDYYKTPIWSTMWRSTIAPGWGQKYIANQKWKLWVFPILAAGIGAGYASSYNRYMSAKKDYEDSIRIAYFVSTDQFNINTQLALLNFVQARGKFDSATTQLNNTQGVAGAFALYLLYNAVDAFLEARKSVAGDQEKKQIEFFFTQKDNRDSGITPFSSGQNFLNFDFKAGVNFHF